MSTGYKRTPPAGAPGVSGDLSTEIAAREDGDETTLAQATLIAAAFSLVLGG